MELLEKVCIDNSVCPNEEEKKILNSMFAFFEMWGRLMEDWTRKMPFINSGIEKIRGLYEKGYFNIDTDINGSECPYNMGSNLVILDYLL